MLYRLSLSFLKITNVVTQGLRNGEKYKDTIEATKRYTCFKETVDEVNRINAQHRSFTAG